jgi:hypothetical protein
MIQLRGLASRHVVWLAPLSVLGLIGFSVVCGAIGIDFGLHWDEHYHVSGVLECVDGLTLWPHLYIYGSLYFYLGLLVLFTHHVGFLPAFLLEMTRKNDGAIVDVAGYDSVKRFQAAAHELLASNRYVLETRMVFFCVSALAAFWVYLTVRKLSPGRYLGALGAAAFVALCWELQYHARFIAVDAVVAQFMAAELYLLSGTWTASRVTSFLGYYVGAAIVAAVLFACKATGLVAFLPVLLLPLVLPRITPPVGLLPLGSSPRGLLRRRLALAALAGLVWAMTVLVLQPGTAYDFLRYAATLRREGWEYALLNADNPNVILSVGDRMVRCASWLFLAVPSHYPVGAGFLSAIVALGSFRFVRDRPRLSILGGVVVLIMLAMMVTHPLFFVRQYLMLIPFMAVGFGAGLTALHEFLGARWPWALRSALLVTTVIFALNARWLYAAALSIKNDSAERELQDLAADLLSHPEPVRLSPSVFSALSGKLAPRYRCRPPSPNIRAQIPLAIRASEGVVRTNRLGLARRFYGARWINFDWYPPGGAGSGPSPLYVLSPRQIEHQGIKSDQFGICEPLATAPGVASIPPEAEDLAHLTGASADRYVSRAGTERQAPRPRI